VTTQMQVLVSFAAVLGALVGVVLTNVVNVLLERRRVHRDEQAKNREILRMKGEELVITLGKFEDSFRENIADISSALISGDGKHPVEVVDLRQSYSHLLIIGMLIRIYFPSLLPALEELEAHKRPLGEVSLKLVHSRKSTQTDNATAGELLAIAGAAANQTVALQKEVLIKLHALHLDLKGN
jgi:hypothetical protein